MKSLHIFIFLGLFSAATYAQTVTLPPYYGVQSSTFKCGISTVKDYEGNVYNTVKIGNQCWLKENLRSTKYNDSTNIPNVTDNGLWPNLITPAYCWYNNDYAAYGSVYGALYNWHTVNTGKLCPIGWHVPSKADWTQLSNYLGGEIIAGGKLKEIGTTHWYSPNTGATNETNFTALPGGGRMYDFGQLHDLGNWWSSSPFDSYNAETVDLRSYNTEILFDPNDKKIGFSVRCVKD